MGSTLQGWPAAVRLPVATVLATAGIAVFLLPAAVVGKSLAGGPVEPAVVPPAVMLVALVLSPLYSVGTRSIRQLWLSVALFGASALVIVLGTEALAPSVGLAVETPAKRAVLWVLVYWTTFLARHL